MKKYIILIIFLSFLFFNSYSQTLEIDGEIYTVDTLENHLVGPGTHYVALRLQGKTSFNVFFFKTDLKNPYIEIRNELGKDSIYTGERTSELAKRKSTEGSFYFAGTNGDFYVTQGYVGYPVGGNMVSSQIARTPTSRELFAIDNFKVPDIGRMTYSGNIVFGTNSWTINSVNHLREEDRMVLFNQLNGKFTHTNEYGTEVLIELLEDYEWGVNKPLKARVKKIEKGIGNMAIPEGQAVLSGHGTAAGRLDLLSEGDEIEINLNLTLNGNNAFYEHITAGDNYGSILWNGAVNEDSFWDEIHPRTGLGFTHNRDSLVFCVVDGRSSLSYGINTKQLAYLMKSAGAWYAINMDGGGSSCMYIAEYDGPVNQTSDGTERAVCNSIYVVSTAPTDNEIGIIKPYKPVIYLPPYGEYVHQFYGYNQYEVLLNSDVQDVVLACPESLGTIEGNKFTAAGNTSGIITATYNGNITTTIKAEFVPVSEISIRLDTVLMDNRSDYPIEVLATTAYGRSFVSPAALEWTVEDTGICRVENGVVRALKNGSTLVEGTIDGTADKVMVKVEIPEGPVMTADKMLVSDWSLSVASQYTDAQLTADNIPQNWEHGAAVNFTHKTGRSPFIKLNNEIPLYGLPDTVKVVLNTGDIQFTEAIISLRAANDTKTATKRFTDFPADTDYSLAIPVDELFDTTDRGIYPLWFDNMNFYLATSNTTNKAYALAVKEIQLVYNGLVETSIPLAGTTGFYIYPNPVISSVLNIQLKDNYSQAVRTEIYSISGQMLQSDSHGVYAGNAISLPVKNLSPGTYLLKVYENEKAGTIKFVLK